MIGRLHELTAVVADEWPTIGHAVAGLQAIDEWGRRHHDARGCFDVTRELSGGPRGAAQLLRDGLDGLRTFG